MNRVDDFVRYKEQLARRGQLFEVIDRDCTTAGCGRKVSAHGAPCPLCGRAPEHHADGDVAIEWEGRARVAAARRAAGSPLDALDMEALERHPTPRLVGAA